MEYPPEGPPDCEVQQEYIPPYRSDDKSDKSITHNDLHEGNVLIAAGDPSDPDLAFGTMLKVS